MRQFILIICIMLIAGTQGSAQGELPAQAEKAYREKRYDEAIKADEALISQGFTSGKLYYNLANAYYRNNQLGKAIYNYELAHKLNPTDQDVINNLNIANSKTLDKIDAKTNFFANVLKTRIVNSLSTNQWAWCSIILLALALALLFCFFSADRPWLRKACFFTGSMLLLGFIISMSLGFVALQNKAEISFGVILEKESKVYGEPQSGDQQKFSLHEGTRVKVLETNKEWTSIKLENGNEGWIRTEALGLF